MKPRRSALATLFAVSALLGAAASASVATAQVPAEIRHHEVATLRTLRSGGPGDPTRIHLNALGRDFDLVIEPAPLHAPEARTLEAGPFGTTSKASENRLYRGHLADDPQAEVRVYLHGSTLIGRVRSAAETWYFEPESRFDASAPAGRTVVYRASDVDDPPTPAACGSEGDEVLPPPLPGASAPSPSEPDSRTAHPRSHTANLGIVDLTMVGDHAFHQAFGANAVPYLEAIVGQVDAFYVTDIDVTLRIAQTVLFTEPDVEPFSSTDDPLTLLNELGDARLNQPEAFGAGALTHLLTGRNFDSNVIGIAYVGVPCRTFYGVGLSRVFTTSLHWMTLLVGHEIGHNLGARHDGQSGSPCESVPFGFVMWPSLSSSLAEEFSPCSRSSIAPVVEDALCIENAIPQSCGDGILDPGEQCDDGNNLSGDCCRPDCTFDILGARCDDDGNECTDDLCNGSGTCQHLNNSAPCDDGDACTLFGLCADGSCGPSTSLRSLIDPRLKARLRLEPDADRLVLSTSIAVAQGTSTPTEDGALLRFVDENGETLHESFVPPEAWTVRDGSRPRYRYKGGSTPPPQAAGLASVVVKNLAAGEVARVKAKYLRASLGGLAERESLGLRLLLGDASSGTCGSADPLPCNGSATSLLCRP